MPDGLTPSLWALEAIDLPDPLLPLGVRVFDHGGDRQLTAEPLPLGASLLLPTDHSLKPWTCAQASKTQLPSKAFNRWRTVTSDLNAQRRHGSAHRLARAAKSGPRYRQQGDRR